MGVRNINNLRAYGIGQPLISMAPIPYESKRNPTANDLAPVGQPWVNKLTNTYYILTSMSGNQAVWTLTGGSGGSGTFDAVDITGTSGIVLQVAVGGETSLGGDLEVDGVTTLGQTSIVGELAITNQVTVNSANEEISINSGTGAIGISTDDENTLVGIANGDAVKTVIIGSATAGSSVTLVSTPNDGLIIGDVSNFVKFIVHAGDPDGVVTAYKGSISLNPTGSGANDRMFVNTDGGTGWTNFVSAT